VVDDAAVVLHLLGSALPQHGFDLRLVSGGLEAVEVYRDHPRRFDLVLIDLHMEEVDGPQTLALLRAVDPEVRCCFMTALPDEYSEEALLALGVLASSASPSTTWPASHPGEEGTVLSIHRSTPWADRPRVSAPSPRIIASRTWPGGRLYGP
jgi:CheY-like chemotaxis protein